MPVVNEYIPGDETSFTIIAFPVPAIGEVFPEIFKETIRINTLDYELYRDMQQKIIDVLDTAEYVEITGKGENQTNMQVQLAAISNPEKQTKFENCVADVNIPLGEVFTSPKLAGTNGILNVGTVYIGDIQYRNLRMEFKDGRVVSAVCDNFVENGVIDQEAGHRLIVQGIMNGHETLPSASLPSERTRRPTPWRRSLEFWTVCRSLSSRRWDRTLQLATPATAGLRTARCTIRTARR